MLAALERCPSARALGVAAQRLTYSHPAITIFGTEQQGHELFDSVGVKAFVAHDEAGQNAKDRATFQTADPDDGDDRRLAAEVAQRAGVGLMISKEQAAGTALLVSIRQVAPIQTIGNLDPADQFMHRIAGSNQGVVLCHSRPQMQHNSSILALGGTRSYTHAWRSPWVGLERIHTNHTEMSAALYQQSSHLFYQTANEKGL